MDGVMFGTWSFMLIFYYLNGKSFMFSDFMAKSFVFEFLTAKFLIFREDNLKISNFCLSKRKSETLILCLKRLLFIINCLGESFHENLNNIEWIPRKLCSQYLRRKWNFPPMRKSYYFLLKTTNHIQTLKSFLLWIFIIISQCCLLCKLFLSSRNNQLMKFQIFIRN